MNWLKYLLDPIVVFKNSILIKLDLIIPTKPHLYKTPLLLGRPYLFRPPSPPHSSTSIFIFRRDEANHREFNFIFRPKYKFHAAAKYESAISQLLVEFSN